MRRRRWQIVLPIVGLLLFGFDGYASYEKLNRETKPGPRKYFWWNGIRLEREPLKIEPKRQVECPHGEECVEWDPQYILVEPSPIKKVITLTGLPAFLLTLPLIHVFDRFGADQLIVFVTSITIDLAVWYWFLGWLIDRRRWRKQRRAATEC